MAERFFVSGDLFPGPVDLDGPEAHHLSAVCRVRRGDTVVLFNGDGREYPAVVEEVGKKQVALRIQEVHSPQREHPYRLELASPLPKGDRADFLVEKLTELGVTLFYPLQTARSIVHPREAKLDRLRRHVIEASKQCGRNVLMQTEGLQDWSTFCQREDLPSQRILAHPGGGAIPAIGGDVVMAVGPEGGFTEEEVDLARQGGWQIVSLGPRILRMETAALALATLIGLR